MKLNFKRFTACAVILILIIGGLVLFADNLIKGAIEKAGTTMWGAKVEVAKVDVGWSPLGVTIKGFTIASKEEEFKNIAEIEKMNVSLLVKPLLEGKINMDNLSGTGLAFGTERESSGFLQKERKEKREKVAQKWKSEMAYWIESIKGRAKEKLDVKSVYDPEKLKSLEALKEAESSFEKIKEKYDELDKIDPAPHIESLMKDYESLKKTEIKDEKDIAILQGKIEKAQGDIEKANSFISETDQKRKNFIVSVSKIKESIKAVEKARQKDQKLIMSELKLPSIEVEDISETLFGPLVVEKFNKVTQTIKTVRKYIPPPKEKEEPVKIERDRGADIVFTKEKMYPPFLIEEFEVSGGKNSLNIEDFTTTQHIHGKPLQAEVMTENFNLGTVIDHRTYKPSEKITARVRNFDVAETSGELFMESFFEGEKIDSKITWRGRGLLPAEWNSYLKLGNPEIVLEVSVKGTLGKPQFGMNSNLDKLISDRLRQELQAKINQAKAQVEELLDREMADRRKKLEQEVENYRSSGLEQLNDAKAKVEKEKEDLREAMEKKKQEMQDNLEEGAQDAIKDLFK